MFENRARYLADPEHHCVVRGEIKGDQELLQKELDLMRGHSAISLERFRGIEREMEIGAFALVDKGRGASKGQARSEFKLDVLGRAQGANKSSSE
jgi:hypothetical protein